LHAACKVIASRRTQVSRHARRTTRRIDEGTAAMLHILRTATSRLMLGLAIAFVAASSLALAQAGPARATLDPCEISPDECATVWADPAGNGSGVIETTNGLGGVADLKLACRRSGGTTYGDCSQTYFIGTGKSLVVYLEDEPLAGSEACGMNICKTTPLWYSWTLTPGPGVVFKHTFQLLNPAMLHASVDGDPATLTSNPVGIDCGNICGVEFATGSTVQLSVAVPSGEVFRGWSIGPCQGQGINCTFQINGETTISAKVVTPTPVATPTPTPTAMPKPTPSPTAAPIPTPKPTATPKPRPTATLTPKATATPAPSTATPSSRPVATPTTSADPSPAAGDATPAATSQTTAAPEPTATGAASSEIAVAGGGPTGATSSDGSGLVILAIAVVVAGLLIALALFAGLRSRRAAAPSAI
jgi:hypothetical protein